MDADGPNADQIEFWNNEGGAHLINYQTALNTMLDQFGHAVMDQIGVHAGEAALDIGCGCGDSTIELARRVGPKGKAVGVDISETMLVRAEVLATHAEVTNAFFEPVDVETGTLHKNSFDLAFSRFGIMFLLTPLSLLPISIMPCTMAGGLGSRAGNRSHPMPGLIFGLRPLLLCLKQFNHRHHQTLLPPARFRSATRRASRNFWARQVLSKLRSRPLHQKLRYLACGSSTKLSISLWKLAPAVICSTGNPMLYATEPGRQSAVHIAPMLATTALSCRLRHGLFLRKNPADG
jgi:SAM-dependent methyltransferase